ncbi:enoyl-CoA hydratase/isomerase family protein [Streptomyces sp. ME19-01-6]|uniref:enoyl-CoA hydratase/isomerase family protein n=1 Tax=Streptomyces sp. ME19-01-6 TaxID=3028686 RepID=UPI0029BC8B3B|nr:enoyl-CoA hydratase/isomerase family protein [Streptomyces sp. ME19-01-6]MDX3228671.1 enoyl-CoA hydratase/isomerase family protein [Streptomyces sp. ME19-01-6]
MALINVEDVERVRLLTLAHEKPTNPFGKEMAGVFMEAMREADGDENIDAIVVSGGRDRCFSAGGDFNEALRLATDDAVNETIDWCTDLYLSVLDTSKPTIAAIDRHAIGLGFQLAMMFDWKMMTTRADLVMPELEHGIGASMAATIISTTCGYDVARHAIMSCRPIAPDTALRLSMVDEVCEPDFLLDRALQRAQRMGRYPNVAFSATKRVLTDRLRTALEYSREESKAVHRKTFAAKAMHKHFGNILGTQSEKAASAAS